MSQQQPDTNPILHAYKEWILRTPFITRNSVVIIIVVYILSWFLDPTDLLSDIPHDTVLRFQFYRLILAPLVGNCLLSVLVT